MGYRSRITGTFRQLCTANTFTKAYEHDLDERYYFSVLNVMDETISFDEFDKINDLYLINYTIETKAVFDVVKNFDEVSIYLPCGYYEFHLTGGDHNEQDDVFCRLLLPHKTIKANYTIWFDENEDSDQPEKIHTHHSEELKQIKNYVDLKLPDSDLPLHRDIFRDGLYYKTEVFSTYDFLLPRDFYVYHLPPKQLKMVHTNLPHVIREIRSESTYITGHKREEFVV